jgi:amidase
VQPTPTPIPPTAVSIAKVKDDEIGLAVEELIYASATMVSKAIRTKEVSSEEVVMAYLRRIEDVNPRLNAVVQMDAEGALAQARQADKELAQGNILGPLHGVPMTIKDNLDTAGMISTGGTKGRSSFVPEQDATVVSRLRDAGAILLGKTNTPELTLAYETDNLVYGRTNNPYDLSRTCGGSSGGAASIIAVGGTAFDIGSDTGGSIRLPSHFCGTAGIRPTSGRVPRTGHILPPGGLFDSLTQIGPMARYVEDLITILPIISGVDWIDPAIVPMLLGDPNEVDLSDLRVAFHTDNGIATPTKEIRAAVESAAEALDEAGASVTEAVPPNLEQSTDLYLGYLLGDGGASVKRLLKLYGTTEPHPWTAGLLGAGEAIQMSSDTLSGFLFEFDLFRSQMLSFLQAYDVVICPVNAFPAMRHGGTGDQFAAFMYTATYNLTGWPGAVVRVSTSPEELPIGVQVIARPWREDVALATVKYLEEVFGGWLRPTM